MIGNLLSANQTENFPEWQAHFDKYCIKAGSFEIPRPFIAKARMGCNGLVSCDKSRLPVLAGGLCPYGERYFEFGKVWVFVMGKDGGHYCLDQRRITEPDLEEYKAHFKKDVETMKYFIENKMNKALGEEISRVALRLKKH